MSEQQKTPDQTTDHQITAIEDILGKGIARTCTDALLLTLDEFRKKHNELRRHREHVQAVLGWLNDNLRGIQQLAAFMRSLGGQQKTYWTEFAKQAHRLYGYTGQELELMFKGTWRDIESLDMPVSSEIPF
jgi:hypothetical protein